MELSQEQRQMVREAIGDGSDFPKFTRDPLVNHKADMIVCDVPPWEELSKEEQNLYYEEVAYRSFHKDNII